jgi:hypothetical protein
MRGLCAGGLSAHGHGRFHLVGRGDHFGQLPLSSGKLTSFGGIAARRQLRRAFTRHMACGRYGPGSSGVSPIVYHRGTGRLPGTAPGRSLVAEAPKLILPGPGHRSGRGRTTRVDWFAALQERADHLPFNPPRGSWCGGAGPPPTRPSCRDSGPGSAL